MFSHKGTCGNVCDFPTLLEGRDCPLSEEHGVGILCDFNGAAESISLLADYGLLFIVEDGQAKRPYLPYERIHLDVEFVGRPSGEGPTPAR
ncbi:hypothetical protein U3A55_09125 [Salarchaeum sp. III]|uniref:hypothetical protein n=1 Tax=Salarchaeum sp. III TaxID=3107927 RepID=UPI002EDA2A61